MSLENSETMWSSELKWCKAFVEMEEEKSYCGHVLDYWWSLAGKLIIVQRIKQNHRI